MSDSIYWDIGEPLSYNALFNMICGPRGVGKSYGAKKFVIKDFIKKGKQFVYVRRFAKELKTVATFFNDVSKEFPDHKFSVKGRVLYIDGKEAGYAIPLSTAKVNKSQSYPNVGTIIFDEFILDVGVHHYLPDEVISFLELYETIARMRDVRVFFLSNAITIVNPYYLYFNLSMPKGKNITVQNDVLLQYVENKAYEDAKSKTRFGKMISGTQYGDYAIKNKALRDDDDFIKQRPNKCRNIFTFTHTDTRLGVWWDYETDEFFVSEKYDPNMYNYVFINKDHNPNTVLLKGSSRPKHVEMFFEAYKSGNLYFETKKISGMCKEILYRCI